MIVTENEAVILPSHDSMGRLIHRTDPYEKVMQRSARSGDCLIYTGATNRKGYGFVSRPAADPRSRLAHRIVWEHHNGIAPREMVVMHTCDTPACVALEHLRLGTPAENSADMVAKGRSPRNVGDSNPRSKITEEQAGEIVRRVLAGETRVDVARSYGLHSSHVGRIVSGERRRYASSHPAGARALGYELRLRDIA